ncbi:hypothetical protein [Dactylosporangium sp. CA-233914]|uniref:hypothetical protein n=1 Tax=Dactylosporangium sp. CA-233914 TaxID=3239934 RepID=UPI003D910CCE
MRLRIREEVGVARAGEVVVAGVPVAAGATGPFTVRDPSGAVVAAQELWRSGGWATLAFPATLDAMASADLTVGTGSGAAPARAATAVADGDSVVLDTGRVRATVRPDAFDPLGGLAGLREARVQLVDGDGVVHAATSAAVRIVHNGPLLARVELTGRYGTSWAFAATVTATAGAPHLDVELRLINDMDGDEAAVAEWAAVLGTAPIRGGLCGAFDAAHRSSGPFTLRHRGAGHARGIFAASEVSGGSDWTDASSPDYHDRWEWAELHGLQGTNWVIAETETGPVTVAVHRFGENHPADLAVGEAGVSVRFWPRDAGELRFTQGAAKTRRVRVIEGADRLGGLRLDHPLVGHPLDPAGAPRILPYLPERYPNLEAHIREELFGWYQSGQSQGFHDLGDSVQGITTGPRTGYSANNEHDALYALALHYLRSGERAHYDSASIYADHLCDIDLIHHSTRNAFEAGGVRAHGRAHVHYVRARTPSGEVWSSIDTGHMWTEGLVLFAQISGEQRYLDAARLIGDCLIRLHGIGWTRPEPGPRNSGWPLIALTALARATGESSYLDTAAAIARQAVKAQADDGRWLMRLGLHDDYCAWQNAVLLTGLANLLALQDDPAVRAAIVTGCRSLVDLGRNPDGTFIYLRRFDYRWANRSAMVREALALGFDLTGDERLLAAGLQGGGRWYRPRGAAPALSNDIAEWRGHLPFLARAHDAGLLTDLLEA